jgi:hypothetical protein
MELLINLACFVAGGGLTALGLHWLRKNKPATYDKLAEAAKKAGDQVEAKIEDK